MVSVNTDTLICDYCHDKEHKKCNGFALWDKADLRKIKVHICLCDKGAHPSRAQFMIIDVQQMLTAAEEAEKTKTRGITPKSVSTYVDEAAESFDTHEDDSGEASINKRAEILRTAEKLINGDRAQVYGAPEVSFGRIADIWNAQGYRHHVQVLGQPIGVTKANELDAVDAALILIGMNLSRTSGSRQHEDNWIDLAGYAGLGAELAMPGPDTNEQELIVAKWDDHLQCYICSVDGTHIDQFSVYYHLGTDHPGVGNMRVDGGPLNSH